MTRPIHTMLRVLLLPLFVLFIAPIGLLVRAVADPLQLRRSDRDSYLRFARGSALPDARTVPTEHTDAPRSRGA